jgi:hypothetical protein
MNRLEALEKCYASLKNDVRRPEAMRLACELKTKITCIKKGIKRREILNPYRYNHDSDLF